MIETKTEQLEKTGGRPWGAAALWMLFLGPFFFLVWGLCSWITSLRSDVGTLYFEWEKRIPLVPLMIIPYVSIDLFFAGSTFLCSNRQELHTLVKRIVFAILISAMGFLLFPLRLGFERPQTAGLFDNAFDLLDLAIGKHNLFPSLHISLRWIIWDVYRRHTQGFLRVTIGVWFVLIALSTVLAYQHHVIDVVGGDIVAMLSFYLFREPESSVQSIPRPIVRPGIGTRCGLGEKNLKVGIVYAFLSLSSLLISYLGWPWSFIFAWPAVALGIMSTAYFGLGAAVFRKSRGRLPFSATALLGPYLLGAYVSSLYYRNLSQPYAEVVRGIILGRKLNEKESEQSLREGITAVLDLTAEYPESDRFLLLRYKNVQILDLTTPSVGQLHEAVQFIREHSRDGKVYVHCALGYTRSALAVAAYLLGEGKAKSVEEAVEMIRGARPEIVLKDNWISVLHAYQSTLS